ncbi:transcriptional regulator [Salmonella enterica subsp. enterica serovar Newport]|uniref:transcriptional regulator n=1 Tax=Salmonella enterica TaxID=28901 RepID=UPI0009AADC1D|nr:transcriptional regulator [Salmonella enterica]
MTEIYRRAVVPRHIIIHGDCWPLVSATEHMVKAIQPTGRCETTFGLTALLQKLARSPDALLILCLRPREHVFLFYALKDVLLSHPALVISDEVLFSDRVVLHNYGGIPAVLHQELAGTVARLRQGDSPYPVRGVLAGFLSDPQPATGLFAVPLIFNRPDRLMNYMELLMYRAIVSCGLTPAQQRLLQEVHRRQSRLAGMTDVLSSGKKKIWQDKDQLLMKLGMRNRLRELLYGTRFCMAEQRIRFITPDEAERLYVAPVFSCFPDSGKKGKMVNRMKV